MHRRSSPAVHQFSYPSSLVWIDPDHPERLCDLHPAWSSRRAAPVRFRRSDYGLDSSAESLADAARDDLGDRMGHRPVGPVRMLTQLRRWGWLFNPISFYFVWDCGADESHPSAPVGVVLEVTNTPWHERTRYPLVLGSGDQAMVAEFDKSMHVSPFLGMDHRYVFAASDRDDRVEIDIEVLDDERRVVLHTALRLDRLPATRARLGRSLRSHPLSTHRVSAGIHAQAARLWSKRVPLVAHPRRAQRSVRSARRAAREELSK